VDVVQSKCVAAWKLVDSLKESIAVGRADRTYPKWSDYFLSFCEQAAKKTGDYLEKQVHPGESSVGKSNLPAVMHGWELLQTFIKPVLDGDNLKVPYPLVHFLTVHVGELPKVEGAKFVIEISPQLTYYQHQHTDLRRAVFFLQTIVNGPPIEKGLGFLGLPCSQSKGLFMNCLLYHEVGHFIAEEVGLLSLVERAELRDELKGAFAEQFQVKDSDQQNKNLYWAMQTVEQLMEELFADVVAVRLVGLAYTLSYMELLRLTDLSQQDLRTFDIDHPADALRFREQLKVLNHDGWDGCPKDLADWKQVRSIAGTKVAKYSVPSDYQDDVEMSQVWRILIDCLCKRGRIASIHSKVDAALSGDRKDNPFDRYEESKTGIEQCLSHGVVPSREQGGSIPHPLAIINGGVIFLLSKMDDLHRTVEGGPKELIAKRAFLESRVEMWCLKAIEDWLVKRQQIKNR
jgi:hypothetical protein